MIPASREERFDQVKHLVLWVAKRGNYGMPMFYTMEDVIQDCWIGVCQADKRFDPKKGTWPAHAASWMRGSLSNTRQAAATQRRKVELWQANDEIELERSEEDPGYNDVDTKDEIEAILKNCKTEKQRQVCILFQELQNRRKVARVLGISRDTVSKLLRQARYAKN